MSLLKTCISASTITILLILVLTMVECGGDSRPPLAPTPVITSVSPSSSPAGGTGLSISITGTNFLSTSLITFNGSLVVPQSLTSTSFTIPVSESDLSTPGNAVISISNLPPGGGQASISFLIEPPNPPILRGTIPSMLTVGGAQKIEVYGYNFTRNTQVHWNRVARPTTYINSQTLIALIGSEDLAQGGTSELTVHTPPPGGGTSSSQKTWVYYPSPTISSLSPAYVPANSASPLTVTVNGINFFPGTVVFWDNAARPTAYLSSTQVAASVLASDLTGVAGTTHTVTASNPYPFGGPSASFPFSISFNVPVLTGISPESAYGNSRDILATLTGVDLGTKGYPRIYIDGGVYLFWDEWITLTENTASFYLPPLSLGTHEIVFVNPSPGGGPSNPVQITMLPTDPPITSMTLKEPCSNSISGIDCKYYVTLANRNLRYILGMGRSVWVHGYTFSYPAPLMDTCNHAPEGCVPSYIQYALDDTGATMVPSTTALSADGRYVSLYSKGVFYVRDTCNGSDSPCSPQTTRVAEFELSTNSSPAMSEDLRFVALTQVNLSVEPFDPTHLPYDVLLFDTCLGASSCNPTTITLFRSVADRITGVDPKVSPSGRFVAFTKRELKIHSQLVMADTCSGTSSCTPTEYQITDPTLLYDNATAGAISENGRYVSYSAAVGGQPRQIYVHDTCAGISDCTPSDTLVSIADDGSPGNSDSVKSLMSNDGRYVVFETDATNLAPHDTNGRPDVYWRDTCIGASGACVPRTRRLSVDSDGLQLPYATLVQISPDANEVLMTLIDYGFRGSAVFAHGPF